MSVQVEKLEKNMAKLTVEVPAEDVEKAIQGAYQKMKKSINIPGFRKGKAPRQLIEKMYGKEVFYIQNCSKAGLCIDKNRGKKDGLEDYI